MTEEMSIQMEHTATLSELSARVEMLEHIFELTKDLHVTLVAMAGDSKAILLRLEQQGDNLKTMVETIRAHDERFDRIEDKMGSKETIMRLHDRVDELEKKDGKKAEQLLGQIKWLLITLVLGGAFAIVWATLTGGGAP